MIDKVLLINSTGQQINYGIGRGDRNLGLKTIADALRFKGLDNIVMLPERELPYDHETMSEGGALHQEIAQELKGTTNPAVLISYTTEGSPKAKQISELVRKSHPNAIIIVGGSHPVRQPLSLADGTYVNDPIDHVLKHGIADFAVSGHCDPAVEVLTELNGDFEKYKGNGLYWIENGEIKGQGLGKFPEVGNAPYVITYGGGLRIVTIDTCSNGCDFCSAILGKIQISIDQVVASAVEGFGIPKALMGLHTSASNLLDPKCNQWFVDLFTALDSDEKTRAVKQIYLDPSLLADPEHYAFAIDFIKRYHVTDLFIGRDCVLESEAAGMGLKLSGELRSQEQLNAEYNGILNLIKEMKKTENAIPKNWAYGLSISYIFNPFDTYKSVQRKLIEMEHLSWQGTEKTIVELAYGSLAPFPGTRIRERYIDFIHQPNGAECSTASNRWKEELGLGVNFLDEVRLSHEIAANGGSAGKYLEMAAKRVFKRGIVQRNHQREYSGITTQ